MSRRILIVLGVLGLACLVAPTAYAASHVIAQASTKRYEGTVYLTRALSPGHQYRIEIVAPGHRPFVGAGFENFVAVVQGRLEEGTKPLTLKGTTPHSFVLNQPTTSSLREWLLAANVQVRSGSSLTVRIVDLGKHK